MIETADNDTELMEDQTLVKLVDDTFEEYKFGRQAFERQWYRNILYLMGNQWIMWDSTDNRWRKKKLASWIPTPVTNKFGSSGQRLVSVLARIEPNWDYTPATDSPEDIASAEMCEQAEQVICEENHIENIRQKVSPWTVYTGNCFLLSGVEPVMPVSSPVNPDAEQEDQSLGSLGMPDAMTQMMDGMDPLAMLAPPEVQEPADYTLYTDVISPFECYIDQSLEDFDDQQKVIIVSRRSKEYVKKLWGQDVDNDNNVATYYKETIGYITTDPNVNQYLAGVQKIKRVTVKRFFMKPDEKYPNGLYVVTAGGKVLEKGELPLTVTGKPFFPIAHVKFDSVPGAGFGRTPMDDIASKQTQRNRIESLIELIALRMGSPVWLLPDGTVVQNFSGAPGSIIKYSQVGDKSGAPNRIPGEQIPASITQFLMAIDKDIEDLVSTFEAMKGQSPYSGAPGVVIEQLIEQGLTRFGPSLRNHAEGYRQWMKHQLEYLRMYGIAEKKLVRKGESNKWKVEKFRGTDIKGAVNVKVESDSTIPRSAQVETAKVLEAINSQLIDITDPMVRLKVLQKLKIQDLMDNVEQDVLSAVRENDIVAAGGQIDVVPFVDNHQIHIMKHKEAFYDSIDPMAKQILVEHIGKHSMIMDAEQNPVPPEQGAKKIDKGGEENLNPGGDVSPPLPAGVAA